MILDRIEPVSTKPAATSVSPSAPILKPPSPPPQSAPGRTSSTNGQGLYSMMPIQSQSTTVGSPISVAAAGGIHPTPIPVDPNPGTPLAHHLHASARFIQSGPSVAVRAKLRGKTQDKKDKAFAQVGLDPSETHEFLGKQPSEALLPGMPDDVKKSRLALALTAEAAVLAKEADAERAARLAARRKREHWCVEMRFLFNKIGAYHVKICVKCSSFSFV